jgi:hypothetical protein
MNFAPFAFQQQVVSAPALPSGIIMYYDAGNPASYPGTGTTITDLSGNGYTATMNVNNGYSSSDGGYWTFNGNNGVSITGGTLSQTLTEWSMWSAIYKTQDGFYDGIMFERTGPGNANGLGFFGSTGRLNVLANNGTEITAAAGASDVVLNNWTLVAGGVDNTTWFRQVYKSGTQYYSSGSKSAGSSNFNDPIVLGQDRETGTDRTMAGRIAVSIMWNRKLSQAEVTQVNDYFKSRYGI